MSSNVLMKIKSSFSANIGTTCAGRLNRKSFLLRIAFTILFTSLIALFGATPVVAQQHYAFQNMTQPSLGLYKSEYKIGEKIQVVFEIPRSLAYQGAIVMVPHGSPTDITNNAMELQEITGGRQTGILVFRAPSNKGHYEFRFYSSLSTGAEYYASIDFTVN